MRPNSAIYPQTIKYRNLVIDLGNGVKTNAQLTIYAVGKGPFPAVLLVHGSGRRNISSWYRTFLTI
ncbi:MAG: hypothetical protein WCF23_20160 [Candidatus Nitrosopolaris sp.]